MWPSLAKTQEDSYQRGTSNRHRFGDEVVFILTRVEKTRGSQANGNKPGLSGKASSKRKG